MPPEPLPENPIPKSPETRKTASIAKLQARGIPYLDSLPVIDAADATRIRARKKSRAAPSPA